jgi:hypothetical protein
MKVESTKGIMLLFGILLIVLSLAPFYKVWETFQNQNTVHGNTKYNIETPTNTNTTIVSNTNTDILLDDYPHINKNKTSNDNYFQIWWQYPIFKLGSFKQITNNLRYWKNPDQGTCERADMCGALYHDRKHKSNIVKVLPEAKEGKGARVGYYRSEPNLLYYSIPTNENILY